MDNLINHIIYTISNEYAGFVQLAQQYTSQQFDYTTKQQLKQALTKCHDIIQRKNKRQLKHTIDRLTAEIIDMEMSSYSIYDQRYYDKRNQLTKLQDIYDNSDTNDIIVVDLDADIYTQDGH